MLSLYSLKVIFVVLLGIRLLATGPALLRDNILSVLIQLIGLGLQIWITLSICNL